MPEQIARRVSEKLVAYANGQPVGLSDRAAVNRILAESKEADYGLRTLVYAIVASGITAELHHSIAPPLHPHPVTGVSS